MPIWTTKFVFSQTLFFILNLIFDGKTLIWVATVTVVVWIVVMFKQKHLDKPGVSLRGI